jgi:hypothetical protein
MNCSQAQELISAAIDGQASADDRAALEAHLALCASCEEQWTAAREVDSDLRRLFAGRRTATAALAERVARQIGDGLAAGSANVVPDAAVRTSGQISLRQLAGWLAAMAAGFLIAVAVFQPWKSPPIAEGRPSAQGNSSVEAAKSQAVGPSRKAEVESPIARLVVATGDVSIRSAPHDDWSAASCSSGASCANGATVRTEPGVRCELRTADECVIRMNDDSELTLRSPRSLELHKGQVWCSAPEDVAMEVYTSVPADSSPCGRGAPAVKVPENLSWSFTCPSNASLISAVTGRGDIRLTAAHGEVQLRAGDAKRRLPRGDTVTIQGGEFKLLPHQEDALLAATWIDALLVKKGHADPELEVRVNGLLAAIGHAKASMLYEQELRGLGEHCVLPLLRYVQSDVKPEERSQRQMAMRIVADLAPAWAVGDLIPLLADGDAEVRFHAAAALRRLTGHDHGREPRSWRNPWTDCTPTFAAWKVWWQANAWRYPTPDFVKAVPVRKDTKA